MENFFDCIFRVIQYNIIMECFKTIEIRVWDVNYGDSKNIVSKRSPSDSFRVPFAK